MLILRHRDRKTPFQAANIKRQDAPAVALDLIARFQVYSESTPNNPHPHELKVLDPAGWRAVWVTKDGDKDKEEHIELPPIPPAALPESHT